MAKAKDTSEQTTVTRVKAKDDRKITKKQPKAASQKKAPVSLDGTPRKQNIFKKFIGYFTGAWFELKQVRWPNRRATWGMTAALLIFTGLFVAFILVTDLLWEYLFKLILR